MTRWRWLALAVVAAIVAGCVPTRYVWSPDGKWMTVIGDDGGMRIADAQGNLLPGDVDGVTVATWFPDSQRVLVARKVDEKTWDALTPFLTTEQIKQIENFAGIARDLLMTYDWNAPNAATWDNFSTALKGKMDSRIEDVYGLAIGIYVRDHADAALMAKIPPARWKELADLAQPVSMIQIFGVDSGGARAGETLMTSIRDVRELRVSSTGHAALVVTDGQNDHVNDLWAISTEARQSPLHISDAAAWYPDWTPDGRDVVFARAVTPQMKSEDLQLGSLSEAAVCDDEGTPLATVKNQQDLAALMYSSLTRVRCLKDGRIVFASANVTLPATSGDMPDRSQLFMIDPGKQQSVCRLLSGDTVRNIGDSAQYFEISPDETCVSIPDGSGKVSVVNLANGNVVQAQDKPLNYHPGLMTVPSCRGDELTMIAPGKDGRPTVVLWSASTGKTRTLSSGWPAGLIESNAATRPSSNP